jgi:hypothetical protein
VKRRLPSGAHRVRRPPPPPHRLDPAIEAILLDLMEEGGQPVSEFARSAPDDQRAEEEQVVEAVLEAVRTTSEWRDRDEPERADLELRVREQAQRDVRLGWSDPAVPLPEGWLRPGPSDLPTPGTVSELLRHMAAVDARYEAERDRPQPAPAVETTAAAVDPAPPPLLPCGQCLRGRQRPPGPPTPSSCG